MIKKKVTEVDDEIDWGFTILDEEQIDDYTDATNKIENLLTVSNTWKQRAWTIYEMIIPLLDNLSKDSEKEYIYWPNRNEKIEQFKRKMKEILDEDKD